MTKPDGKYHPKQLRQWVEYPALQQEKYDNIHKIFHPKGRPAGRYLDDLQSMQTMGGYIADRPLKTEKDLEVYEREAAQNMASEILKQLGRTQEARSELSIQENIIFENYPNGLADLTMEAQQGSPILICRVTDIYVTLNQTTSESCGSILCGTW